MPRVFLTKVNSQIIQLTRIQVCAYEETENSTCRRS